MAGKTRHDLQFSLSILNFTNLLSHNWGVHKLTTTQSPLTFKNFDANNHPVYTWQTQSVTDASGNSVTQLITNPFQDDRSVASTWQIQLGLRYSF